MATKKKSRLWRNIIIFLSGVACGTGSIAMVATYVNNLHLPFIKEQSKTHLPVLSPEHAQNAREAVEFQDILRHQQPLPLIQEGASEEGAQTRLFDYYLQVGAFKNEVIAEDLRGKMSLNGYRSIINTGTLADGSVLYRIWMGPYESEDQAEQQRAQLALSGYADVQLLQKAR